jgi:hypothetical protein
VYGEAQGDQEVTLPHLEAIEITLKDKTTATPKVEKGTATEYGVASESNTTKDVYKILRNAAGEVKRTLHRSRQRLARRAAICEGIIRVP